MDWVVSRCGMNMENVMDEGCIRMRGLPYGCTKEEVAAFFSGIVNNSSVFIFMYYITKQYYTFMNFTRTCLSLLHYLF